MKLKFTEPQVWISRGLKILQSFQVHAIQSFNLLEVNRPEYFPWRCWEQFGAFHGMRPTTGGNRTHRAVPSTEGKLFWSLDLSTIK